MNHETTTTMNSAPHSPKAAKMCMDSRTASLRLLAVAALLLAGCQVTHVSQPGQPAAATTPSAQAGKGGAQLWSETCMRCHNVRSPSSYSDAEWELAMHHMRIRANLTAEEHRKILEFLKSAN